MWAPQASRGFESHSLRQFGDQLADDHHLPPGIETMKSDNSIQSTRNSCERMETISNHLWAVRNITNELSKPLSAEDQCIQSMSDASPTKWHLAHTTWFFETFVLKPLVFDYTAFNEDYGYLFNSYYEQMGPRHERSKRGLLSRPSLSDVYRYRQHVEDALKKFLKTQSLNLPQALDLIELGIHHEQQHQELLLTDIKHVFSCNPLKPQYHEYELCSSKNASKLDWVTDEGGLQEIGHSGNSFAFDCEKPRHNVWLEPFQLATRPVTNKEFLEFILAGGYKRPELWLSDGWAACQKNDWQAPLYWESSDGRHWNAFTLSGLYPLDPHSSVCHISFFEADAYARWAGKRLPTEEEWEVIAAPLKRSGNFSGNGMYHPESSYKDGIQQVFGDVWEWTASAYRPYPGYSPEQGAVGEYNGKFMSNQMVLRGGSCVTPEGHIRSTYRNFFYPQNRWQFSGVRLADSIPNG